ncbi:CpsD/CapB family tyrosine-protein kinase [Paenibacillus caui]|uniref:CpsD/CapB family tyrosine-protein kinase n=1 Tax=Paenibacillus caui TaxID=2873927 RepID=UPI001CA8DA46|nr:CpsD/CapB family tyrosine-protein kinase [Paenibacillus caui]
MLCLNESLVAERNPTSSVAESVRSLRVYIRQHLRESKGGTVLLLTSAHEGEGKSVLVANLAVSFAQEGRKTCVVDGNLRNPSLHLIYDLNNGHGLTDYLIGNEEAENIVRPCGTPGLSVITAGEAPPNPSELLGSERMEKLFVKLRQEYEIILLDSPNVLDFSDARVLAARTDGAVLVVKYGRSKREAVRKAKQYMDQAGVSVLGIAMNQVK